MGCGADMEGEALHYEADLTGPMALVVGGEGQGLARLTKDRCDFLVRLPMYGQINSLNAAVAAAVLMYEITRQRQCRQDPIGDLGHTSTACAAICFLDAPDVLLYNGFVHGNGQAEPLGGQLRCCD